MKRIMDIVFVVLSLPLTLPAFLVTLIAVRLAMGQPVFFRQRRAGMHGRPFTMIKFRTMRIDCDREGNPLPDAERITSFGNMLRQLSLDELPELLHVLTGKMSLVGPRPLPVRYVDRYTSRQARRLETLPGITGWAQINGRNLLTWEERFDHDVWYVDNRSFLLDLKILVLTMLTVVRREGITAANEATMHEFTGKGPDVS